MDKSESSFQKYKRRLIKPRAMKMVGNHEGGKLSYPSSIKSTIEEWRDYKVRKFWVHTHYHSVLTGEKTPVDIGFWYFNHADTSHENMGIHSDDLPLFVKKDSVRLYEKNLYVPTVPNHKTNKPRKIVVPHRKTLDNHGLNITAFQKDNYLGIPVCVSSADKTDITEGWVYAYNTVVDGVEGLYFEVDHEIPFYIQGNIHFIP